MSGSGKEDQFVFRHDELSLSAIKANQQLLTHHDHREFVCIFQSRKMDGGLRFKGTQRP
jgi:hypothetical protein